MKKKYLVNLFFFLMSLMFHSVYGQCEEVTLESLSIPGPYSVAALNEEDGIRNGPDYNGATIYYPTNGIPPYASIAIVPGFVSAPSSVEAWGPFYASHGIVTIIIGTNSPIDFPEARAYALIDALETIKQENIRPASPLLGDLNLEQMAVSGWSMGGGGAQRAAVLDPTIAGVVALCPWLPNPNFNHDSAALIFSGQDDTVAPPFLHADLHYEATPVSTNKLLFEVENGDHSVANSPTGGDYSVGKIALSWLKLYVEQNDCYCPLLTDNLLVDPPAASKVEQDFICELLANNSPELALNYYPNPTQDRVYFEIVQELNFELYSPYGQRLQSGQLSNSQPYIDLSTYALGIYYLNVDNQVIKLIKTN